MPHVAPTNPERRPSRLDRRGVALPMALLGLVVVTLLVTTALLTSSTELALSSAHTDGARSLYHADAAIQGFVGQQAALGGSEALRPDTVYTYQLPGGESYRIRVNRLVYLTGNNPNGSAWSRETYALVASPSSGRGRVVGALIRATRNALTLVTNFTSGAVSGGDFKIQGNATISNRSESCADTANNALEVSAGSKVTISGNPTVVGDIDTLAYDKSQLVGNILGGVSLDSLSRYANIKFGPRFNKPAFNGRVNSGNTGDYNWGCPASLGVSCGSDPDTAHLPVVAIDANGGTVTIEGDWGQGILVVVNGSLALRGNFIYNGIILVEKDLNIGGGQGQFDGKIEGAVLSLGQSSTIEDGVQGNAVIRYSKCAIKAAENALNGNGLASAAQNFAEGTFAWFEVVR
ncbi:MAG TPA: hypothetical protein VHG28_06190 [Longimicrobiaceae bacterium]|nr:hypothetical protein [Longimicrobiaceae bacterium]